MNILVVGCGKVGQSIVQQLSKEKHDISVIDVDAGVVEGGEVLEFKTAFLKLEQESLAKCSDDSLHRTDDCYHQHHCHVFW